ncbi:hypothetical protein [Winslowiella iniecta]|uniref:Uncharacterized protein n=1 Tax=Winslowiella iniecta TaxID=1560201 RepID=A0A0L7T9X5_9GAMM|nr:hypothetical protein [Winslowiella iniecta]KOC88836.1 hypothetical protein NG43_19490 [Winslowiella iniecta]KOC92175.1 hypothetical protein NG42_02940 [Winslowiella iniecta]
MRLQLLGVGSVPVLTLPIKDDDDSIINLSALARWLDMKRTTLFDHIQAKGLETAIREAAIAKRMKKLNT